MTLISVKNYHSEGIERLMSEAAYDEGLQYSVSLSLAPGELARKFVGAQVKKAEATVDHIQRIVNSRKYDLEKAELELEAVKHDLEAWKHALDLVKSDPVDITKDLPDLPVTTPFPPRGGWLGSAGGCF